jgi:hypothetical protein
VSTVALVATTLLSGGENKKSGPIGLAVILLLCVACYFLFKSMSKHLRKVREEFPADATKPPAAGPTPPSNNGGDAEQPVDPDPPPNGP